jgi:phage recombination protein Bet
MATSPERGLIKYESRGQEVILSAQIVRDFLVTGKKELVTDQEIFYFLGICKARQLNPFVKDCYLIKYGTEPAAIVTAIDFYRSRARAAEDCTGWEKGVICLNKETGTLRYSKGLVLANEELVGGWFRARPTGWTVDFELEVNLAGYIKTKSDGGITKFWQPANQASQIMKVAESQGLRTVWPDLFQGTYTADERNFDLDDLDAGGPPPAGSAGDITPKPEEPKLDTSKFDKAVKKLKWDQETMARLDQWLAATSAAASTNTGKVITADMVKMSCANKFEEFLDKFKEWLDLNFPPAGAAPGPGPEAAGPATTTPPPGEHAEDITAKPPEEKGPPPAEEDKLLSLEDRREAVWKQVINKGIPLASLAVLDPPVSAPAHITEQNIDEAEELVATYQASTGKGKK